MLNAVRQAWPVHIKDYEGRTRWLYWDTHTPPLPTTGTGNMIGSPTGLSSFGLALPWRDKDGNFASEKAIAEDAERLRKLTVKGDGHAYEKHAKFFLDDEDVDWLLFGKTDEFFAVLKGRLPEIDTWPADAQLALMNMAWWMGPRFLDGWPNLTAALKAQDWVAASRQCTTVNKSQRNPDNVLRFETAARVQFAQLSAAKLYNPHHACAKFPVYPKLPLGDDAQLSVSTSSVRAAGGLVAEPAVWYVQLWLSATGHYAARLDGLRGSATNAALRAWARSNKISYTSTQSVLAKLAKQAGSRMPVVP